MVSQSCFNESLVDSVREVFETMMFMALEECQEPDVKIEGDALVSTITFKGALEGFLGVMCSLENAKVVAANMLGLDPADDISLEELSDAMGEVANMVLGSIKKRILPEVGEINVSIPSVIRGTRLASECGEDKQKVTLKANLDGCMMNFECVYIEV